MELWRTSLIHIISTKAHLVFPPQPSCFFGELIYEMHGQSRYRVSWNPQKRCLCSSSICISKTHLHTLVHAVSASRSQSICS